MNNFPLKYEKYMFYFYFIFVLVIFLLITIFVTNCDKIVLYFIKYVFLKNSLLDYPTNVDKKFKIWFGICRILVIYSCGYNFYYFCYYKLQEDYYVRFLYTFVFFMTQYYFCRKQYININYIIYSYMSMENGILNIDFIFIFVYIIHLIILLCYSLIKFAIILFNLNNLNIYHDSPFIADDMRYTIVLMYFCAFYIIYYYLLRANIFNNNFDEYKLK